MGAPGTVQGQTWVGGADGWATAALPAAAIAGDFAAVGLQTDDGFRGAAYVLERRGDSWGEPQQLVPSSGKAIAHFGAAVAIGAEYAAVGAPWEDVFRGAVYVFRRSGDRWVEHQRLAAGDGAPDDRFGSALSFAGDDLLIGTRSGVDRTYRFGRTGDGWVEGLAPEAAMGLEVAPGAELSDGIREVLSTALGGRAAKPAGVLQALVPPTWVDATDSLYEDRVEITWPTVGLDAVVYRIYRGEALLSVAASDDSVHADETGAPGTTYSYCVSVMDMHGTETAPACDDGTRIIFPPERANASDGLYEDYVQVTWTDRSAIEAGYYIHRDGVRIDSTKVDAELYRDTMAVAGVTYEYEVLAFDRERYTSEADGDDGYRGIIFPPLAVKASDGQYPGKVVVTWRDQAEGELGYNVYRDGGFLSAVAADAESFVDHSPAAGQTHQYCVRTLRAGGAESAQICDSGGIGILPPPNNVAATDLTLDDRVEITWADTSNLEDGFYIDRDGARYDTTGANSTWYSDAGALPGTPHQYCVSAFSDSGGVSTPVCDSGTKSVVLAPTNAQATDGSFEGQVEITWESVSTTAVLFRITRDDTLIKTVDGDRRVYRDQGGTAGADYQYCVSAVTALEGTSATSCDQGRRDLRAPTGLAASDEEYEDRVEITWTDNSNLETGYRVYRDGALIDSVEANLTSYIDQTGEPGAPHDYAVAAYDTLGEAVGESAPGEDQGLRVLVAPTGVAASDGEFEGQVEVTWKDKSGAEAGYRIYRDGTEIGTTAANQRIYNDDAVTTGAVYEYEVVAFDDYGESGAVLDSGSTVLFAPGSFNASDAYADSVVMTWVDASARESGYRVYRDNTEIGTTGANVTSYVDNTTGPGEQHEYCARAYSGVTESEERCDGGERAIPVAAPWDGLNTPLAASHPAAGDSLGRSVAMDGDYAIVGAPYYDHSNISNSGIAFVFHWDGDGWVQQDTLFVNEADGYFGSSVAISGDCAIVGQPGHSNYTGQAFIFRLVGGTWTREDTIWAGDYDEFDHFGESVAISGDYALVGAYGNETSRGSAYVFKRTAVRTWTQQKVFYGSSSSGRFGWSVAIRGQSLIVGANGAGGVYTYQAPAWGSSSFSPIDRAESDHFGFSVDTWGDYAVVGAPGDDDGGDGSGSAYVLHWDGSAWTQQAKLTAPEAAAGDAFGTSVRMQGDYVLVGAPGDDDMGGEVGSAYLFARTGDGWTSESRLVAGNGQSGAAFGRSVDLSRGRAAIGAPGAATSSDKTAGAAYFDDVSIATLDPVTASDGTLGDRVQIKWQDRQIKWQDHSAIEEKYRVYRDGALIEELAPDVQTYNDYEAQPGRAYEYGVSVYNSQLGETEPALDFGRRPPDGNITGRVATRVGEAVEGASVCLDPAPNHSVLLDGELGHVRIDNLAMPDTALTVEMWVRTAVGATGGAPFTYTPPGQAYVYIVGVDELRAYVVSDPAIDPEVKVGINDGQWHHLALTWRSSSGKARLLVDGDLPNQGYEVTAGQGQSIHALGTAFLGQRLNPDGFQEDYRFRGEVDEVRLWNRVRDEVEIKATMYQRLAGDEDGLVGYWPLDQGVGTVVADLTAEPRYGRLKEGAYWSETGAPLKVCATTDVEGNYVVPDVCYGTSTTFKVKPELGARQFEPAFKTITLSTGSPVQNEVAFTDISSFTVSGQVRFANTSCFASGVEIWVDDVVRGTTDRNGQYAVSLEVGTHTIEPRLADHSFDPPSAELTVEEDTAGVDFLNTTVRTLSCIVAGGCGRSIGTATLQVRSISGCLVQSPDAGADYSLELPPQKYTVRLTEMDNVPGALDEVDVERFFGRLGVRQVDLTLADTTLDFTYRAPLKVEIGGFPDPPEENIGLPGGGQVTAVPVVEQGETYALTIAVFEDYGADGRCPLDTGKVIVYDELADAADTPVELVVQDGIATYETTPGLPNITTGRKDAEGNNRSYQKALTVVTEVDGRAPKTEIAWVIVTGDRPRTGTFVSAVTEEFPLLIVRDPPGDGSYSFVEEGASICSEWNNFYAESVSGGFKTKLKVGARLWTGLGVMTRTAAESENLHGYMVGLEAAQHTGFRTCVTTTKRFSTSGDELFIGRDGDVYLGIALNLLFAKTDEVEVKESGGSYRVETSEAVAMGVKGFKTTYLYTDAHIRNALIPQLEELAILEPDSAAMFNSAAANWRRHLALNDSLKGEAKASENRSFSAGADYEYRHTADTTSTLNYSFKAFATTEHEVGFVFEGTASGIVHYVVLKAEASYTRAVEEDTTKTRTWGYILTDNDIGDFFTVDVKNDPVYGTPVFELRSGTSSCPWEPGTQPRDALELSITPPEVNEVLPDALATFTLGLGNLSESDEAREYVLRSINATNPGGAILRANGSPVHGGLSFFLNPGQTQEVTLSVERGPNRYNYEDLALMLVPPCEYDCWGNGAALTIADTVHFDVRFQAPCSDIVLYSPVSGWAFSQGDQVAKHDSLKLQLSDFELKISEEDSIHEIGAQYRPWDSDTWQDVTGSPVSEVDLQEGMSKKVWWDLSYVPDGVYGLRAYTDCADGQAFSGIAVGAIDRQRPQVFGTPEPADGVLSYGEDISIAFNEPIQCGSVRADSITVVTATGASVPVTTSCDGRTVVLALGGTVEENTVLTATVRGVKDLLGNPMEAPAVWSFTVRRSQFAWRQSSVTKVVQGGDEGHFAVDLVNGSGQGLAFTIVKPAWLSADPLSGEDFVGVQAVDFGIAPGLPMGSYADTVKAGAANTDTARLAVSVTVTNLPPLWAVEPKNFDHSMAITAEVLNAAEASAAQPGDLVAAFVGREVRGVASVELVLIDPTSGENRNLVNPLTAYSDQEGGETLRFEVWKLLTGDLYPVADTLHFAADASRGTPADPVPLHVAEDTAPPQVVGDPQPADGLLGVGDLISVTFDEYLDGGAIEAWQVSVSSVTADEPVATTWTLDEKTLILSLAPSLNLENQLLRAKVKGIRDPYGNARPDSVIWEFTVDRNAVYWQDNQLSYAKYPDSPATLAAELHNRGGRAMNYRIEGLPEWLTASPATGEIAPGGHALIVLTLGDFLNYGTYADTVYARGDEGDKPLFLDLRVMAQPPDWSADAADYHYSMGITGELSIDAESSTDEFDLVGAFVNGECRGAARVQWVPELDRHLVFLTVYANLTEGEEVTLRVWDALEGVEYARTSQVYAFNDNSNYGVPTNPVPLEATPEIIQRVDLPAGWYWLSFNVTSADMSVGNMLGSLRPADGDLIKSQSAFDLYDGPSGSWVGTLGSVDNQSMYMIKLAGAGRLETYGAPVSAASNPIGVVAGWNWIGYPLQRNVAIDLALLSLGSTADDLLKNQVSYAQYVSGSGWHGSATHMEVGRGYMLHADSPGTLVYPPGAAGKTVAVARNQAAQALQAALPEDWEHRYQDFEYNMTVTGQVLVDEALYAGGQAVLGAFVEDQCRGVAFPQPVPGREAAVYFLMVYGHGSGDERVTFRLYDTSSGDRRQCFEELAFAPDANTGNLAAPFLWTAGGLRLGDGSFVPDQFVLIPSYPNPFNPATKIGFGVPVDSPVKLEIYNSLGQRVRTLVSGQRRAGYYQVMWNGFDDGGQPVTSGVYLCRMTAGSFAETQKMLLMK
ncbi:MAG: Ig-like domain-containing protein [Gemmatimonadota bacterium]